MKSTLLCLAGGGARGIWQAGALKGVLEHGIQPSGVIGISVGALNAGFWLSNGIDDLTELWRGIKTKDVYNWAWWRVFSSDGCLYDSSPLYETILDRLNGVAIQSQPIPFHINVSEIGEKWQSRFINARDPNEGVGLAKALLASASPLIAFPPVVRNGALWVDGGHTDNFGVAHAVDQGAQRVIMISPTLPVLPKRQDILGKVELGCSLPEQVALDAELAYARVRGAEVFLIRPEKPLPIDLLDFDGLGERGRRDTFMRAGYLRARDILKGVQA